MAVGELPVLDIDQLLWRVSKPARYVGGEWNSVRKEWEAAEVRLALAYPEAYEIAMSSLGLTILYEAVNGLPYALAERVCAPWPDMEAELRRAGLPLFSLESRRPLRDFDLVGFSLGYELKYSNVLACLDLGGVPILSSQRSDRDPIVIAGGHCAFNPEPMAEFVDLFVVGDGEDVLVELVELMRSWKGPHPNPLPGGEGTGGSRGRGRARSREEFLRAAVKIRGVYVPRFYEARYRADGTVAETVPMITEAPAVVERAALRGLPPVPTRPIVPFMEVVHERAAIEIQRGCTRGCRFCQAGMITRPMRRRSPEEIVEAAGALLRNTGFDELAFLSLSSSDYPEIEPVVRELTARYDGQTVALSLPSTRVDQFNVALAEAIEAGPKRTGLTFAPEAGTARLRSAISKGVSEEDLMETVETAFSRGWTRLKLYFMVGLPTEELADVEGIVDLAHKVLAIGRRYARHRASISVGVSTFVPKPHTPYQWSRQDAEEELGPKHSILIGGLRRPGIRFSWNDPRSTLLEGVLTRGDRRVGAAIRRAFELGCRFDAWEERYRHDLWLQAFAATGVDPAFYNHRERPLSEIMPWEHIAAGVGRHYLLRDFRRTRSSKESPDCMYNECYACGIQDEVGLCDKAIVPKRLLPMAAA